MSESVSYRMRALSGKAGEVLFRNLGDRGIFFHDQQAWATAKERVEKLHAVLERELEKYVVAAPCEIENSSAKQEWDRAGAMLRSFYSVPEFKAYAELTKASGLQDIRKEMDTIRNTSLSIGEKNTLNSMHQLQKKIEGLATQVQEELCQMEKEVLLGAVSGALENLGYIIERTGEALKATLKRSCIWVETNPWGEVSLDCSGFSGLSCLKEVERIEDRLTKEGIMLSRTFSQYHGRPEGGCLVGKLEPLFPIFKPLSRKEIGISSERPKIRIGG